MTTSLDKIESGIIEIIRDGEKKRFISERDEFISDKIIQEFYTDSCEENQIEFKDAVSKILFKYFNTNGEFADSVIYHLLYVIESIKVPIDNILVDILSNQTLLNRFYKDDNLNLITIKVLTILPISARSRQILNSLIQRNVYRESLSYNLHFLELFAEKEMNEELVINLDNLVDLNIQKDFVNQVELQLFSSLPQSLPNVIGKWYESQLNNPTKLKLNFFNKALLLFVEDFEDEEDYYDDDWKEVFNRIKAFSFIYGELAFHSNLRESQIMNAIENYFYTFDEKTNIFFEKAIETLNVIIRDQDKYKNANEMAPNGVSNLMSAAMGA
jgi:hypothetical protein